MSFRLVRMDQQSPETGSVPADDGRYLVMTGDIDIGRITRERLRSGKDRWYWGIYKIAEKDWPLLGAADTLEDAALELAQSWRSWLKKAHLAEEES